MTNDHTNDGLEIDLELFDEGEIDGTQTTGPVELKPTRDEIGERLDKFIANHLPELSRTYIQQLIEQGDVRVDNIPRRRTFKMTPGQTVTFEIPAPVIDELEPEAIPLNIVYEDADVLVIDKPAGMVVHPAPGHPSGTVANAVVHHAPEISIAGSNRPGIVHRLDKDTSGLMVIAKTDRARVSLVKQWNVRSVEKLYVALASGVVEPNEATVDVPVGRDPVARSKMAVVANGRDAVTHFTVRERFADASLLDLLIDTGRTHQIRVHLDFIGHPVVGDRVYNRRSGRTGGSSSLVSRQFLHASRLAFELPGGTRVSFDSPLPEDLQTALETLEQERAGEGTE
jgi:23S rRNA pseudouridine1911/1915/1917 synthase